MKVNAQSFLSSIAFFLVAGLSSPINADLIQPDTAVASSEFSGGYIAENTINGSGMPGLGSFLESDIHATYLSGNHWTTSGSSPLDQWIEWGFDSPQSLRRIIIWNHLSNGVAANPGYEPTVFDLTLLDASDNVLLFLDDVSMTPDTGGTSQSFGFGSSIANISKVRFDVEAVQSSPNYTGLAEVAFSAVPEPSSAILLLVSTTTTLLIRRRSKFQ